MKERTHVAAGTIAAVALAPWLRGRALALWLGASLADADLYAYYVARHRQLDPRRAVRYYNTLTGRRERARKLLHHPLVPLLALAAAPRSPAVAAFGAGLALHLALDLIGDRPYERLRRALERRSGGRCENCGRPQESIAAMEPYHLASRGGRHDLDGWRLLCRPCSEVYHREMGTL